MPKDTQMQEAAHQSSETTLVPAMPDKITSSTVSPADSDGEIVSPKKCGHDTAPSSKASAPIEAPLALADDVHPSAAPATAASEHSPDVALKTPPAKRTLMQQVEDSSSGSNKKQRKTCRGEIVQNTPVSNQKRDQCELCHEKRSSDQRGAYCELCVKAFRKQTGHQRIAACKDDASLMDRVIEFSKTLRGNKPQGAAQSRKSFRARMADIERMLGLLLAHFDLK